MSSSDETYMRLALEQARAAASRNEVPIGAVLVDNASGDILSRAGNRTIGLSDPTAHAEILAIRAGAEALGNYRLPGCTLYVTLEPCTMCAGAISFARLARVVMAAEDPKGGGVLHGVRFFDQPTCHHRPEIASGVLGEEAASLLRAFFAARR